ncbi:6-hydroxymethylpterin diphosphokinase MptE-like protein [Thiopseudomonas alkaliphila]|uniref:6-hydroxymethylpterin diphosphokinase MptE-like protein n=1 Tax=Thiopseudomonas alkaliphila TaxID=1697053 RepID=UPI0035711021
MNHLSELRNQFSGTVVILASGPSATEVPLKVYQENPVIAVNGAVRLLLEHNIQPFLYMFNDGYFVENNIELVKQVLEVAQYVFMPEELYQKYFVSHPAQNIYFIHRVNRGAQQYSPRVFAFRALFDRELVGKFSLFSQKKNRIGFSKNLEKGYYCARTIPYVGLQAAYYLGFNKVLIAGLDLNSELGRFYESKNQGLRSTLDKDYKNFIFPSFKLYGSKVRSKDFEIINLSLVSRLPDNVLPKKAYF